MEDVIVRPERQNVAFHFGQIDLGGYVAITHR